MKVFRYDIILLIERGVKLLKKYTIKYDEFQRLTRSGCEDIRFRKFEFVAKTEFLCVPSVIAFLAYLRKIVSILFYFIL